MGAGSNHPHPPPNTLGLSKMATLEPKWLEPKWLRTHVYVCVYIYIYIYVCIHTHTLCNMISLQTSNDVIANPRNEDTTNQTAKPIYNINC